MTATAWKERDVTLQRMKVAMHNSFGMAASTTGIELSIPFENCARKYDANCKENKTEEFAGAHAALGGTLWTTLGDATGFAVEGYPPEACWDHVEKVLRPRKAAWAVRPPFRFGRYTDDTQLMRELAVSLVEHRGFAPEDFAARVFRTNLTADSA
jgi:ADP-ribosylglycohydrolase